MLHKYTNVSGAPEIKVRRQSPVIGGARLYPGSTVTFTDAELAGLPEQTRRLLDAFVLMEPPVLDYETFPDLMEQQAAAVASEEDGEDAGETGELERKPEDEAQVEETVSEDESVEESGQDENTEESQEEKPVETTSEDENAEEVSEDESAEESGKNENAEAVEEVSEEVPASGEEDTFDYDKFLSGNVKNIKSAFAASDPPVNAVRLIEVEKASENPRNGLIGWLEQHSN